MGITIKSNNFRADMGYGGFGRFRKKVAELTDIKFGEHYKKLDEALYLSDKEQYEYFKEYDKKTKQLVEEGIVTVEIANFCYQSDSEGEIDQDQAIQIYEKIKDYNDNICYGYSGRSNCAMFSDLKNIFKDCSENGDLVKWS